MAAEATDLKTILSQAEWRGGEQKAAAKESLSQGWKKLKDVRMQVASAVSRGTNLAIGLTNPDTAAALIQYTGEKKTEAWNNTKDRLTAIKDAIGAKKDNAVAFTLGKLGDLRAEVGRRVVSPTIEGAKTVAQTIDKGVVRGELLGYFAVARTGMAVETGVEKGKMSAEAAVAKGKEWNGRMQTYFRDQGELLKLNMDQGKAKVAEVYFGAPAAIVQGAQRGAEGVRRGGEAVAGATQRGREAFGNYARHDLELRAQRVQARREQAAQISAARTALRARMSISRPAV